MKSPDELQAEARRQETDKLKTLLRTTLETVIDLRKTVMASHRHFSTTEIDAMVKESKVWLAERLFDETSR